MERLTERDEQGNKLVLKNAVECFEDELRHWTISQSTTGTQTIRGYAVDKFAEYEDLEEQGLLLKPKCQPGDIVWEANKERNVVSEYEVASIRYGINKTFHYMWVLRNGTYSNLDGFHDKDINKTVFLTQSEADKELKKIESED